MTDDFFSPTLIIYQQPKQTEPRNSKQCNQSQEFEENENFRHVRLRLLRTINPVIGLVSFDFKKTEGKCIL